MDPQPKLNSDSIKLLRKLKRLVKKNLWRPGGK